MPLVLVKRVSTVQNKEQSSVEISTEHLDQNAREVTKPSVLDESFTLRQLIESRFNIEHATSESATNLLVRGLVELLQKNDPAISKDESFESILNRALLPTENAFADIKEFESAIQKWNVCNVEKNAVVETKAAGTEFTSLLSKLERLERAEDEAAAKARRIHAIARGAVLDGRYVILDV